MGDSEPSKKRGALKELSRGLDDSDDDTCAFESGSFKTASEEVLATRRILRVDVVTNKQEAHYDGIRSDAPIVVIDGGQTKYDTISVTLVEETEMAKDDINSVDKSEAVNGGERAKDETKTTTTQVQDAAGEEKAKDDNINFGKGGVDKDSSGGDQTEIQGKEGTDNSGAFFPPFHLHSNCKNAFSGFPTSTTAFSVSSFSFGSTASGSVSRTQLSSYGFSLPSDGTSSIFGTTQSAETGEEKEETAFTADSVVLFEFLQGGWKERGKGQVKVNVSTTTTDSRRKARLLMRSKGNYRLILNASLYPEMKLASMDKKVLTFASVNSVSQAKTGLSTFALKFKDPAIMEEFREVIEEHKESKPMSVKAAAAAAAPLKTPENSPRAEQEDA
ncbi:Nuclear pore complex protein NUP50B [Raphanus sativus]|uniref:Nuclear pore complex protein NUP50B-like n=1 Tax=Raphanus sativus TaxID=3726 RepID=A0A9W3DS94_RAPSA|nr:nuclear pore complex protein NUP50B-like [Raphanus sativus]KAJ4897941.1 Nuclear pore complex protein NUP50B [Raphanus sativus]